MSSLWLGIDLGTTSIKLALVEPQSKSTLAIQSMPTDSSLVPDVPDGHLQSVGSIFKALVNCLALMETSQLTKVRHITVTGQKHGLVLWNRSGHRRVHLLEDLQCSPLYTWLDGRCHAEFLQGLEGSNKDIATGYGGATMLWLKRHQPEVLDKYSRAGTIMDCLVDHLVDSEVEVLMSRQNARCWGFYSFENDDWNRQALLKNDFPMRFLPQLKHCSDEAGSLAFNLAEVNEGAKVYVASGDLQASFKAALLPHLCSLSNPKYAYLSVSTSAQLALIVKSHEMDSDIVRCDPYEDDDYIALAAALNGGNVLAALVNLVKNTLSDFGHIHMDNDHLWKTLLDGVKDYREWEHECPTIDPAMFGERHRPTDRCSISEIRASNLSVKHLFIGLCKGIMTNLAAMMDLSNFDVEYIVATGSCMKRIPMLAKLAEDVFGLPVLLNVGDDDVAPVGSVYLTYQNMLNP